MNDSKEIMLFLSEKLGTNDPNKIKLYLTGLDKEKLALLAEDYKKWKAAKKKKAEKGTKLNYIKILKHQCPEGLELYFYKIGGLIGCGCKKKEDGGEIAKAQEGTAVNKFKNRKKEIKQDLAARDSIRINSNKGDDELEATRPGSYKPNPKYNSKDPNSRTHTWVPDRTKYPYKKATPIKTKIDHMKEGSKVKKVCGGAVAKFKTARCGSKIKKHQNGGSLNGIPFINPKLMKK